MDRKAWLLDPDTRECICIPDSPIRLKEAHVGVIGDDVHFIKGDYHVTYRLGAGWTIEPIVFAVESRMRHVCPSDTLVVGRHLLMRQYGGQVFLAYDTVSNEMEECVYPTHPEGYVCIGGVMLSPSSGLLVRADYPGYSVDYLHHIVCPADMSGETAVVEREYFTRNLIGDTDDWAL
ncbi:hypothetical protein KIPB_002483 [Kipferlia bialata]|uniref:Uncharacterized protein n=1 Tax=Kipferlia bialata TaxID=797122 RepID=A0A391NJD5_9EUKA|nr:hypothetical protein KIPB_002483 [Kipferlia bialata]|eukprot:g2483.t1